MVNIWSKVNDFSTAFRYLLQPKAGEANLKNNSPGNRWASVFERINGAKQSKNRQRENFDGSVSMRKRTTAIIYL